MFDKSSVQSIHRYLDLRSFHAHHIVNCSELDSWKKLIEMKIRNKAHGVINWKLP